MMIENIFPILVWTTPPNSETEAARRICEHAGGSLLETPLTRLVGCIFKDLNQLKEALKECKFGIFDEKLIMKSGPYITTYLKVVHSSQTKYDLVVTQSPDHLMVNNVKFVQAPYEKPEAVAAFKAALNGNEEESS